MKEYCVVCIMQSALVSIRINTSTACDILVCSTVSWYQRNDTYKTTACKCHQSSSPPEDPPSKFPAPLVHLRGSGSAWADQHNKTWSDNTWYIEMDTPWILQVSTETWDDTDCAANLRFFIGFPTICKVRMCTPILQSIIQLSCSFPNELKHVFILALSFQ